MNILTKIRLGNENVGLTNFLSNTLEQKSGKNHCQKFSLVT